MPYPASDLFPQSTDLYPGSQANPAEDAGQPLTPRDLRFDDRLGVLVTHADGATSRWAWDEPEAKNRPLNVSFSTSIPGGFKDCTLTLPRRIDVDYPDLNLLDDVRIYGPGNETVWEGRIAQLPRSHGDEVAIQVGCVGHSAHLRDDPSFSEVYVDRNLGNWQSQSRALAVANYAFFDVQQDGSIEPDPNTGLPSILLTANGRCATGMNSNLFYDAGAGNEVASVYFDYVGRALDAGGAHTGRLDSYTTADAGGAITGTDVVTGAASTGTRTETPSTAQRFVAFVLFRIAAVAADGDRDFRLRQVTVWGNHGLTKRGTAPDDGLYASDVIEDIISRAAPLLSTDIEATGYVIPHLEFRDPTTAEQAILTVNAYHLYEWGVYDDRTFFYRQPNPDRLCWEARLSEGAHLDLEGDQADDIYNGVIVRYSDPSGTSYSVGPTGAGTDAESDDLLDDSPDNPVNAHGIPKRWAILELSQMTTEDGATQIGAVYLAERALPQRRGQLTVSGQIQHPTAGMRPASRVRAGDYVRISDHPTDVPRRVIETSYNHDSKAITMSLDNSVFKLDAILERMGASLVGVLGG